jgi:glucose-6-phosphate 1-epimerase
MCQSLDLLNQTYSIEDAITFEAGPQGLPMINITAQGAEASISCQGAQVVSYIPSGEKPVIWTSKKAIYAKGNAIRGGIPICWPWFGPHSTDESKPSHGIARTAMWHVSATKRGEAGIVELTMALNSSDHTNMLFPYDFQLQIHFIFGATLSVTLTATNTDTKPYKTTGALHSYFAVSDISKIKITGVENVTYIDKVNCKKIKSSPDPITFTEETDRVYEKTKAVCVIHDPQWKRKIMVEKTGSHATVIWNPWKDKCKKMADMQDSEYQEMVCVEAANAGIDLISLLPGESHQLSTMVSVVH